MLLALVSIISPQVLHAATTYPPLTVTSVAINNSSAVIVFQPVIGAKDYRIYDIANPTNVKYAGLRHIDLTMPPLVWQGTYKLKLQSNGLPVVPLAYAANATGPQVLDFPNPEIEWNNLGDRLPHTLIVEAVDALGPVPQANLYNNSNLALIGGGMLGSNKGPTQDGKTSTNGQGPYTNNPQVIAQSQPFVVQASASVVPIPAKSTATQTFLDTFDQSEAASIVQTANDPNTDSAAYVMNAGTPLAWSILYSKADVKNSMPFILSDHLMDMLFDGGTIPPNDPLHQGHGEMAMTPDQTFDFSNGKLVHITMEADGHMSGRRWLSFVVSPSALKNFDPETVDPVTNPLNDTNQAMFLQFFPGQDALDLFNGSARLRLWGAAGQGIDGGYDSSSLGGNGIAFDDRSRFDFFFTQNHVALFKDGELIQSTDISGGIPFTKGKVYFIHYMYHSDQEENTDERDLLVPQMCYQMNSYWYNDPVLGIGVGDGPNQSSCGVAYPPGFGFRYSDERHWDNMGFEVFPSTDVPTANNWGSLASFVKMPQPQAPHFVTATNNPDTNADGKVNAMDFAKVASSIGWTGTAGTNPADVNGDGQVNLLDIQNVIGAWLL